MAEFSRDLDLHKLHIEVADPDVSVQRMFQVVLGFSATTLVRLPFLGWILVIFCNFCPNNLYENWTSIAAHKNISTWRTNLHCGWLKTTFISISFYLLSFFISIKPKFYLMFFLRAISSLANIMFRYGVVSNRNSLPKVCHDFMVEREHHSEHKCYCLQRFFYVLYINFN